MDLLGRFSAGAEIHTNTVLGQAMAFRRCSIIQAIMYEKTAAIKEARWWFMDENGKEVTKTKEKDRISQPNAFQSLPEFVSQIEFFSQIFGKAYIAKMPIVGINDFSLYVIPNPLVTENQKTAGIIPFAPRGDILNYTVNIGNGEYLTLEPEDIVVVNDVSSSLDRFGYADSRLVSLAKPINTFIASYDATHELLVNRGMLGIITLETGSDPIATTKSPLVKSEKEELQKQLRLYGITKEQLKYAITSYKAGYVQISSNISDLGLTDIQNSCKKDIAYIYQIPSVMLDVAGSTFSNYAEAKKKFYTSDIQPAAGHIGEVLSQIYGFKGFKLTPSFDHIDIFQDAKRQQAAGMTSLVTALISAKLNGLMTDDEARNELNKYLV